jgi:hypothetical protein
VAADDRSAPARRHSPGTSSDPIAGRTQTAAFAAGGFRIELSAAPGAARLVVASGDSRDVYVVDPAALAVWADATRRLLALQPAKRAAEVAEYRAPFLIDCEGRESIAFEGLVSAQAVTYRLLISGATARAARVVTTAELVGGVTEAAAGAVGVARSAPT